jgi:hypothetical protein
LNLTAKTFRYSLFWLPHHSRLQRFIREKLGEFQVTERYLSMNWFKLSAKIPLGEVFGELEANKNELHIEQYSVKQTSIEKIPLYLLNAFISLNLLCKLQSQSA